MREGKRGEGQSVPGDHKGLWCTEVSEEVHQISHHQWHLAVHGFVALQLIHELRHQESG